MGDKEAFVYWVRLPDHVDIQSEGYIGITSLPSVLERWKNHRKTATYGSELIFHKAIRKHGPDNLIVEEIAHCSLARAYELEEMLRPQPWTGWNIAAGGLGGNSLSMKALWLSEDFSPKAERIRTIQRERLSARWQDSEYREAMCAMSKKLWSDPDHKEVVSQKISEGSLKRYEDSGPWDNPRTKKDIWSQASLLRSAWEEAGKPGAYKFSQSLPYPETSLRVLVRMFKDGWVPEQDGRWVLYFKGD